jgi:hypothetical protein
MRLDKVLPVTAGLVSAALMVLDVYGQIGVDACQISDIQRSPLPLTLLFVLKAPVAAFFVPVFLIFDPALPVEYLFVLPIIVAWWWWFGARLEFGWFSQEPAQYPKLAKFVVGFVAALLAIFAMQDFANAYRFFHAPIL